MEDDLFLLVDSDGDGAVTLDATAQYFERHGLLPDKASALKEEETPLMAFKQARIDATTFRRMVHLLCAHCRVSLGSVWSVCVEQALYSAFCACASAPEMVVSRGAMQDVEHRLMRHGETRPPDAAPFAAHTFPEFLDYGDFVEFFLVRWPHLSKAKVSALLLRPPPASEPRHGTPAPLQRTEHVDAAADRNAREPRGCEDEQEALLRYAAGLKSTLRSREERVARADGLEAQNAILLETLAVAKEEHAQAQGQIVRLSREMDKLRRELEKKAFDARPPPSHAEAAYCVGPVGDVSGDDARALSLVQRLCRRREQAELERELLLQERESELEVRHEFLLRWEEALHRGENALVQRELETRRRWSEAFLRKERQLERLQETLELRQLEVAAREAEVKRRRLAQIERDREAGELSLGERRRRMQQLHLIEKELRKREERVRAKEARDLPHTVADEVHHRLRPPVQRRDVDKLERLQDSQQTESGAADGCVSSPSKPRSSYLSLLS
ncbi:uncharacterized protein Tco025E_04503 [Trypanosoma conorhini]|uniref:EF-hand domain-containing protein n=1 Tax=Trypanosoma conorhini TaxID=83891 RepID=A0A3R7PDQ9_9TRYP|nr:uncharacterized protein Tco025E_04503 [Trypanosoma conorhini]RNF18386.1 hypothetical protein Tco025E_04503 [Trypanosoma conorhini]